MAVKTEKELSESLRALWLKAVSAIELRNFGYAISLLQEILKQEPEFLTGRQLRRRTEVTKTKSAKKKLFQYLNGIDRHHEGAAGTQKRPAAHS